MSHPYTQNDVLRLAKRHRNNKRAYLLVNPLQAKHLPVSPRASLSMMARLGEALHTAYPDARLVVGFAETATAIGAAVAACFGDDCIYLHTTREAIAVDGWVDFEEEHSHAVEQRLWGAGLAEWLPEASRLLFVDDEISTGKTLLNIIHQLRAELPALADTPIVAASILDRLTEAHSARLLAAGIESQCLVKLPHTDYTAALAHFDTQAATDLRGKALPRADVRRLDIAPTLLNPRLGVRMGAYRDNCRAVAEAALASVTPHLAPEGDILVLGTEECMYPALVLGERLEAAGRNVFCHATTRSPIGVCDDPAYPIRVGYQIRSFYDEARETYLYNLRQYDTVIVLSDTPTDGAAALADIAAAAKRHGCRQLLYIRGL